MTVKQSTLLTNRVSQTARGVPNAAANSRGRVRSLNGNVALATGDMDDNDIVILAGVPTNATILSIKIANDEIDAHATPTSKFNLGLYADDLGVTVKDEDVYATAVASPGVITAFIDLAFEARGIEKSGQKVWQDAGDSVDPHSEYFVAITFSAAMATAAAGDIAFQIEYVLD